MAEFHYEWWTIDIKDEAGTIRWEFKGRDRDHIIKQIEKEVKDSNSEKNAKRDIWHRKARIIEVFWDTLTLDRKGYARRF